MSVHRARSIPFLVAAVVAAVLSWGASTARASDRAALDAAGFDVEPPAEERAAATLVPALREAHVLVREGGVLPGGAGTVDVMFSPFTDGAGVPGFTGDVLGDDNFVWYDGGAVWQNSDAVGAVVTGAEATMGVADGGGFIFSPSIDGADGVWTHHGELARENVQAPGYPAGINSSFHSRPTMLPGGEAFWVAGVDLDGNTSTDRRVLYTSPDATAGSIGIVLEGGDTFDGYTLQQEGISFDYWVSDDGTFWVLTLQVETGSTSTDDVIAVADRIVARESIPTGDGDAWDNFDYVSVNNAGSFLFSGDTDGDTATDEFIAFDGTIALREGDTVDGVSLSSTAYVRAAAINDLGQAVHAWRDGADVEHVFAACDASDLAGTSRLLISTGDTLDLDGDGVADATFTDLETVSHNWDLAENGWLWLEASIDEGFGEISTILGLQFACETPLFADGFESGDTSGWSTAVP